MHRAERMAARHVAAKNLTQPSRFWLHLVCLAALAFPSVASSMDFKIYYQPQLKIKMIIAEGKIQSGDVRKFISIAKRADRDGEGLVTLILNSPGGNVEAAFRIVDAMDKIRVYTAVPSGASCASACASILFASGERRSVLGTGKLGFHSCYRREGGTYEADSLCNEIIAANAMQRGVTHAGINRFVEEYGARDMAWVGRDIACKSLQGLCKPGNMETTADMRVALTNSLECSKLPSVQAQLVCGDAELSRVDRQLAGIYEQKLKTSANKDRLRSSQRTWLRTRNECGDKDCLLRSYNARIDELKRMPS